MRTDHNQVWRDGVLISEEIVETDDTAEVNARTIDDRLAQALTAMQTIIDTPIVTFGNIAGAQTAMRQLQGQVKDQARVLRGLIRLRLNRLESAD